MNKTHSLIICILLSILSFGQTKVTLEDIWKNYKFYPKGVSGFKSMNDGEHYTTKSKDGSKIKINKHSFETGEIIKILMNTDDARLKNMGKYQFDDRENKILIATNTESIYRYSSKSIFYIYNIKTKNIKKVHNDKIMHAKFSPNGKYIAYVFDNNLYIYKANI